MKKELAKYFKESEQLSDTTVRPFHSDSKLLRPPSTSKRDAPPIASHTHAVSHDVRSRAREGRASLP